jgi:HEPN domain-containing protein
VQKQKECYILLNYAIKLLMANRYQDWHKQALSDLKHSQNAREDGDYDWACFAAHQAAEKAVKALIEFSGGDFWGHGITKLLEGLKEKYDIPPQGFDDTRFLDKFYILTRYPNGFDIGAPVDYYTQTEAGAAYEAAQRIIKFCESQIPGSRENFARADRARAAGDTPRAENRGCLSFWLPRGGEFFRPK